jgi:hypothetical protein
LSADQPGSSTLGPTTWRAIAQIILAMTTTDYIINAALIFMVFHQMRDKELDIRSALIPLGLVFGIGQHYLTTLPTAGNDIVLIGLLAVVGISLGIASGFATSVRAGDNGNAVARVSWRAAGLLLVGICARMAFVFAVKNGAGHAIASFSAANHVTAAAWPVALVSMAILEVVVRILVVQVRGRQTMAGQPARRSVTAAA